MTQYYNPPVALGNQNAPRFLSLYDTVSNYAAVVASNYLGALQALGHVFYNTDSIYVLYQGGAGWFTISLNASNIATLAPLVQIGQSSVINVSAGEAALASAGKVNVQLSTGTQQFVVQDVRVMYSASGLSGNSGNRLLALTDGTTVYNNNGITAALLGTPINTLWGGSGNPLPGSVAMNTPTAAGANLYLQYTGGTTDYNAGAVNLQISVRRVA